MSLPPDQPDLIPYASHVSHGTGRTPIGIILFAASHLLLGATLALAIGPFSTRVPLGVFWAKLFVAAVGQAAVAMMIGGAVLLLKGRGAWLLAISAFAWLAVSEITVAAIGIGWAVALGRNPDGVEQLFGGVLVFVASSLLLLCSVVLGYLGGRKARDTFGLPPGETPLAVRWLPRAVIGLLVIAIALGVAVGVSL